MKKGTLVSGSFSGALDSSAPEKILYFPEGTHRITPMVNGKPKEVQVKIDRSILAGFRNDLAAKKGETPRPIIDFDHARKGAAAAIPKDFSYEEGEGLFLHLDWTKSGQEAVEGRDFSYFSPTFLLGKDGVPKGLPQDSPEVGSLVNDPAFRAFDKLAASNNPEPEPTHTKTIMKLNAVLIEAGVLKAGDANGSDDEVAAKVAAGLEALKNKADDSVSAKRIETLEAENKKLTAAVDEQKTAAAKAIVKTAIKEGRIAPKDEKSQEKFTEMAKNDPEFAREVLASIPKQNVEGSVIYDGADDDSSKVAAQFADAEKEATKLIEAMREKFPDADEDELYERAEAENPELFAKLG